MSVPAPEPATKHESTPAHGEEPAALGAVPPAPGAVPAVPGAVPAAPTRVLVLRSSDANGYLSVAIALARELDDEHELRQVLLTADVDGAALAAEKWSATVAIGADAASFAARELGTPIVYCQVIDSGPFNERRDMFGVAAIPPLELQLDSWKQLARSARSVGMIVGEQQSELVAEAREAAARIGLDLHAAVAVTDRDSLYQFKRFAQDVDGILLVPNSEILSPAIIRQILDYARRHRVHSIVFNEALLEWGGLLSAAGDPNDIARTVGQVVGSVIAGDVDDLARVTPLSAVDSRVNEALVDELGIETLSRRAVDSDSGPPRVPVVNAR